MGQNPKKIPQPSDIHTLVMAVSSGDAVAFERLYKVFFPKISRFVLYRVNDPDMAQDLVADIFIKAWESLQNAATISSFSNWIFTIARNRVIDFYRTTKQTADLYELENELRYYDRVIEAIDHDIALQEFIEVIPRLTPDQQQVVRLKFFEDLDNDEIAAVLNKTPGTIRVIQHRALAEMKSLLGHPLR